MRTVASADKIVVIKDGKSAYQGSPQELLSDKSGYFHNMYHLQMSSAEWVL